MQYGIIHLFDQRLFYIIETQLRSWSCFGAKIAHLPISVSIEARSYNLQLGLIGVKQLNGCVPWKLQVTRLKRALIRKKSLFLLALPPHLLRYSLWMTHTGSGLC